MTVLQSAQAGDIGDIRIVQLGQCVGQTITAMDLSTATSVRAIVRCKNQMAILAATVTDAANGVIEVNLGDAPAGWLPTRPSKGTWKIQYEVTFNDGSKLTWPNDDYDDIEVFTDLDAP